LNGSRGFEQLQPEPPRLRDEPDGRVSDTVERPLVRVKLAAGAVGACVGVDLPHPVGVPFGRRWLGPACRGEPKRGPTLRGDRAPCRNAAVLSDSNGGLVLRLRHPFCSVIP
jgi:hypothetical protein